MAEGRAEAEKRDVGQRVNELKTKVEQAVDARLARIQSGASSGKLAAERLDITLPGIRRPIGAEHPVIKTMNEMIGVFRNLGYSVEEGPEIETDYYNFEALNFPPNHPARDTQARCSSPGRNRSRCATVCCCARTLRRCRFVPCRR